MPNPDFNLWKQTKEMSSKFDIVVYKETNENWCGSYRFEHTESGMYLCVRFGWYFPSNTWLVTVWGNDDFGMGKEKRTYKSALFQAISNPNSFNSSFVTNGS